MRKFNLWLVNNSTGHQLVCRLEKKKSRNCLSNNINTPWKKREKNQGYLHGKRLKGQVCHSRLSQIVIAVTTFEDADVRLVPWSAASCLKGLSTRPSLPPSRQMVAGEGPSLPFFFPHFVADQDKVKFVWLGRQEPPLPLNTRWVSWNIPERISTPPTLPQLLPPTTTTNSLFLITHYPIPVSGRECRKYLQAARPELMWGGVGC